jgi:hypothetical protein
MVGYPDTTLISEFWSCSQCYSRDDNDESTVSLEAHAHLEESQSTAINKPKPTNAATPFTISLFGSAGSVDLSVVKE